MALPIFASILLSTVASKVVPQFAVKKLGMDPTGAALLGAAAGFGAGAYGAGVFGSPGPAAGSLAPVAGDVFKSGVASATNPSIQTFAANVPSNIQPTFEYGSKFLGNVYSPSAVDAQVMGAASKGVFSAPDVGAAMSTPQIAHSVYNPKGWITDGYNPAAGVGNYTSTWDKLKAYASTPDQQRYLGNAASTLIEGMMQEKPKQGFIAGTGGGGGGGGMAPPYPGGGGGGQVGVTWGFGGNKGGFVPQPIT